MKKKPFFFPCVFILFVMLFPLLALPVWGQGRGGPLDIFQGQAPPPGAITVLGRAFADAGEKGFGNAMTLLVALDEQNVRQEIGLTETELNSVRLVRAQMLMAAPQFATRFRSMTDENRQSLQDDITQGMGHVTEMLNNAIPAERKGNVQKFVFQSIGGVDSPFITLDSMEALNLSTNQKANLQRVFDEMQEERRAHWDKLLEAGEKVVGAGGPQNLSEEEREELNRIRRELEAGGFETAKKLAERLRQHLTPEQLEKEKELLASRPAWLPRLPSQMRENQGGGDAGGTIYTPGSGSWQPGQDLPVPVQQRERRFPRGER